MTCNPSWRMVRWQSMQRRTPSPAPRSTSFTAWALPWCTGAIWRNSSTFTRRLRGAGGTEAPTTFHPRATRVPLHDSSSCNSTSRAVGICPAAVTNKSAAARPCARTSSSKKCTGRRSARLEEVGHFVAYRLRTPATFRGTRRWVQCAASGRYTRQTAPVATHMSWTPYARLPGFMRSTSMSRGTTV